jgi:hypothetical protein
MLWSYPNGETQGGFINSTSGIFTPDPSSLMVLDNASGLMRTPDKPFLFGSGDANGLELVAASYDLSQHRWLPVPRQYVSPDGTAYAYSATQPGSGHGVHVVNVATGNDRLVPSTAVIPDDQANYLVVAYLRDGVYMSRSGNGPRPGLWRLDPGSGSIHQVSTDVLQGALLGNAPLVSPPSSGNPVAWWSEVTADFSATDPSVYYQYLTGVAGQHGETWFERPGFRINVIGVDSTGHAIVVAESQSQVEIWLLAESSSKLIFTGANYGDPALPFRTAIADAQGWWIGSRTGVFYATTSSFTRVSETAAVLVGGCG